MRFQDPVAMGSRRRYLAEQAVFMAELEEQSPFSKMTVPTLAGAGARYTTGMLRVAEKVKPPTAAVDGQGLGTRLVRRGRLAASRRAENLATDATPFVTPIKNTLFNESPPKVGAVHKADLKTTMSDADAKAVAGKYGLKGPLPKELPREERMRAYEGRYLASGGRKAEKWNRQAKTADRVRNAALAGGVAAGTAWLGAKTPVGRKVATHLNKVPGAGRMAHAAQHHAETAAVATATVGGGAELYAGRARKKRASYAGTPGGVAASALRRMQNYTPDP